MALKPLNSVAGFSVGQTPANVILANGDITTNNITTTGVANLNNVGNVLIYGGSSGQVLTTDGAGNLSWSATGSPSSISNGNSNVSVPSVNGNVYINANASVDQQWIFGTNGNLILPVGGVISEGTSPAGVGNTITLTPNGGTNVNQQLLIYPTITEGDHLHLTTGNLLQTSLFLGNDTQYIRTNTDGSMVIGTDDTYPDTSGFGYRWVFDVAGNLTAPSVGTANLGNLVTANFANFTNDLVVQGNIANANNITVTNNITSDTANVTGNLTSGNANLGNLATANNFATNGTGGDITLTNGNIQGANVVLANSFTSNGGLVDFATNNPNVQLGNVANVHITGGTDGYVLTTDGTGNLSWSATAAQNQIYNGNSNVSIPTTDGNVYINANSGTDQQWIFGTDGTMVFPNGPSGGNIQRYGMGNLVGVLDGGWVIGEWNGTNYGTEGIRISPGVEGNVEVILPSDANAATNPLQLNNYSTGNVQIESYSYYWNFDSTGNTQFPAIGTANLGNLVTANYANFANDVVVQGNIANANNITTTNNLNVGGNITTGTGSGGNISGVNYLFANVANISNTVLTGQIANGTSNIRLDLNGNITISSNNSSNVFTFSDLGANVIGYIQANGIISAGGFLGSNLVSNVGILSLLAQQTGGDYNINLQTGGAGNVDVGGTYITSLHDPLNAQDAATKNYVDTVASGLNVHQSANLGTVTDLATTLGIPSGNVVYNQPGPEGVGATLTFSGNSLTSLDGNTVTSGMRLLIKNESNAVWNGVYDIGANALFITRSIDESYNANFAGGDFLFVQSGATLADTGWVQTTDNVVVGTSNIVWNQFSGIGVYTGANGILVSGTVITANVDNDTTAIVGGNITVKVGANLVTPNIGAATGTSLDLTGNVLAGNLNSNATITAVDASFTGNLEVGGNITTTGATGNISGANVIFANSFVSNGGLVDFNTNSANVQLGSNANVHLYGGSNGQVLQTDGAGNLNWYSISANSISNGNSNVSIPTANGNVYINASGADQWVFDTSGVLTAPGQVNVGGNLYMANDSAVSFPYGSYLQENSVSHGLTIQGGTSLTLQTSSGTGNIVLTTDGGSANFDNTGNFTLPAIATANLGNLVVANTVNTNTVNVGPLSQITYGNVTTVGISANQTIASLNATGITGAEFLVKAIDSGGKYSVATVLAVTDGTDVDYTIYGTTQLGGYTGSLAVNVVGGYLRLQVTPASSNSTVWVTQARTI